MPIVEPPELTEIRDFLSVTGSTLLDTRYSGVTKGHAAKCKNGHHYSTQLDLLRLGFGKCKECPNNSELAFRRILLERGATLIQYNGTQEPSHVICIDGHECHPRPAGVISSGKGICRTCVGLTFGIGFDRFKQRLNDLGATLLEDKWLGAVKSHKVRCVNGHDCTPRPHDLDHGQGICKKCVGTDSEHAEKAFKIRLVELGATYLQGKWLGVGAPHHVRCANGHDSYPRPNSVQQGHGICFPCGQKVGGRKVANAAEKRFIELLADQGAEFIADIWLGAKYPHKIRCRNGHITYPRPTGVQQGKGVCRYCKGMVWDVFYVVVNNTAKRVKFGVTSGDPKFRLSCHRTDGYSRLERCYTDLPDTMARDIEINLIADTLPLQGFNPVKGREYFDISALPIILDYVDTCMGMES